MSFHYKPCDIEFSKWLGMSEDECKRHDGGDCFEVFTTPGLAMDSYLGMACQDPTNGKWAATFNMVPLEGDDSYYLDTREDAAEVLLAQARRRR